MLRTLPLKLIVVLGLVTLLTSCGISRPPPQSWVEPIHFSDETKEWLLQQDPPDYVWEDLWKVAKHNQKVREILQKE